MNLRTSFIAGASSIALGMASVVGAHAQDAAPAAPPVMEQPAPAVDASALSEDKLQSFAVAFVEVSRVTQSYQPQFETAQSDADRERIQMEAGQQMIQAVDAAEGITVDEYNQIIQAAQADPELAQKINGHITQAAAAEQQ
jgi:hypothetical protein